MTTFQLLGLDPAPFVPLFALSDAALRSRGAVRVVADSATGYPCRVSFEEASVGDELLLLPCAHVPAPSPYAATGPIFVRRGAQARRLAPAEVPPCIASRLVALRSYDAAGAMLDADVCAGDTVAARIHSFFADPDAHGIHLHYARRGCFACRVERA